MFQDPTADGGIIDYFSRKLFGDDDPDNDYDYEPIEVSEVKEETPKEYLTKPVQTTNLLEFSDEEPYIYDQKQIGFYFTRNLKTTALLLVLCIVIYNSFSLFWESVRTFLDNLL